MLNQCYRVYFNGTFMVASSKEEYDRLLDKIIRLKVKHRVQSFTQVF